MSKRFGRNQKRRMREAIAQEHRRAENLAASLEMDRGLLREQRRRLEDAEEYACMVADLVGDDCVAVGEPRLVEVSHGQDIRKPVMAPIGFCTPFDSKPIERVRVETLRRLEVEAVRSRITPQMHIRTAIGNNEVGYCISESALRDMPERHLVERLSVEIARMLVRELRGAR